MYPPRHPSHHGPPFGGPGHPGPPFGGPTYPGPPSYHQPITNPAIPYVGALPRLCDGHMIKINGFIPATANRFHINLSLGPGTNETADIALHINPRFDGWIQNCVVRNSFLNRQWGLEEKSGKLPLTRGQNFECIILVTDLEYRVAFNGAHFCEYKHRTAKETVTHLNIGDDVTIFSILITDPAPGHMPIPPVAGPGYPPIPPPAAGYPPPPVAPSYPAQPGAGYPPAVPQPTFNLPMPYKAAIPGSMKPGRMVVIHGITTPSPYRFAINLCYFDTTKKDIAFHFNPRFDEKVVVRNALAGSSWGREERKPKDQLPFAPNTPFQVMILCEHKGYKVAVNGTHFTQFEHRLGNLNHVRHIIIEGNVMLSSVTFQ